MMSFKLSRVRPGLHNPHPVQPGFFLPEQTKHRGVPTACANEFVPTMAVVSVRAWVTKAWSAATTPNCAPIYAQTFLRLMTMTRTLPRPMPITTNLVGTAYAVH